jgi:hypothetical protein
MLDAVGGGAMGASMISFKEAAADGSFTINETGGKALLAAIDEMMKWVDDNLMHFDTLSRELPLGTSKGAEQMKPYVQQVATDDQGFITQLKEFRKSLADAQEGVKSAMRNYGHVEQGIQGNFRAV